MAFLASDPSVDVNWIGPEKGDTALHRACRFGHLQIVETLLKLAMVDVNAKNTNRLTPLWIASQIGHLTVVQLILASGREIDTQATALSGFAPWREKTAAGIARFQGIRSLAQGESDRNYARRKRNCPLIAELIDSFDVDPATTHQQLRELPELRETFIGDLLPWWSSSVTASCP